MCAYKKKIGKNFSISISDSGRLKITPGIDGLSLSVDKKGAFLDARIPGTGISKRIKLSGAQADGVAKKTKKSESYSAMKKNSGYAGYKPVKPKQISQTELLEAVVSLRINDNGRVEYYKPGGEQVVDESLVRSLRRSKLLKLKEARLRAKWQEENRNKAEQINAADEELLGVAALCPIVASEEYCRATLEELMEARAADDDVESKHWYAGQIEALENVLSGDINYLRDELEYVLEDTALPFETDTEANVSEDACTVSVRVRLPDYDIISKKKAQVSSSGCLKISDKSSAQLNREYNACVFGLAIYLTGLILNLSTKLKNVIVSGYIEGLEENESCLYSVCFTRERFEALDPEKISPQDFFLSFENHCELMKSGRLKAVRPLVTISKEENC